MGCAEVEPGQEIPQTARFPRLEARVRGGESATPVALQGIPDRWCQLLQPRREHLDLSCRQRGLRDAPLREVNLTPFLLRALICAWAQSRFSFVRLCVWAWSSVLVLSGHFSEYNPGIQFPDRPAEEPPREEEVPRSQPCRAVLPRLLCLLASVIGELGVGVGTTFGGCTIDFHRK